MVAESFSLGKAEFFLTDSLAAPEGAPKADEPFRILVLGDFSGRSNRGVLEPGALGADREPIQVDRDNFDEVLAALGVGLRLDLAGDGSSRFALSFDQLDTFHPDHIFRQAEVFRPLRETRRRLEDPRTYEAAAALVRGWAAQQAPPPASTPGTKDAAPTRDESVAALRAIIPICAS